MRLTKILRWSLGAALPLCFAVPAMAAETHGYVISWFATATHAADFATNCPENRNGGRTELTIRALIDIGYTREEALDMVKNAAVSTALPADVTKKMENRAIVNGKPQSIYNYPEAVHDPNLETVIGKFAYGFDLGGRTEANKFEDPDTRQKVDNQLWRAVGCTESFRAIPPVMPYPEELAWNLMIDTAPAWVFSITGDDLSKDGKVTVTLDRVTQHMERDASGNVLSNMTYVLEQGTRSHNVLQGEIKDGMLSITPAEIYLEGEMPYYSEIAIRNTHMRINTRNPDAKLVGYWGGYINWTRFIYMYTSRPGNNADSIGLYHALKRMADSDPDPKTGQNRYISTTWRMEATPAYIAKADGKIIASPAPRNTTVPEKVADASVRP